MHPQLIDVIHNGFYGLRWFDNPNTNSPILTLIRQYMFVYFLAAGMGKFFDGTTQEKRAKQIP